MRTVHQVFHSMKEEMPYQLQDVYEPYIKEAMRIYAKEVATETLKRASKNAGAEVHKGSITDTKIITP